VSFNIEVEDMKFALLKGCLSELDVRDDKVIETYDRFFFRSDDLTDVQQHPTKFWKIYDVGTIHEISGRLNLMWLTDDGRAVSTRRSSHFTILNWAIYNYMKDKTEREKDYIINYFWNPLELQRHNVDDPVILQRTQNYEKSNNLHLSKLMEKFMKNMELVRLSGPYRDRVFGGGGEYGHANKLLDTPHFSIETFNTLTERQEEMLSYIINHYHLWNVDVSGDNNKFRTSEVQVIDLSEEQSVSKQLNQR
jgi:hypothetical protein